MKTKKYAVAKMLGSRLRTWRLSVPLKSIELAEVINITQPSLSELENNKTLPSAETIAKLLQYTDINIIWLLTGKGPMRRQSAEIGGEGSPLMGKSLPLHGEKENEDLEKMFEKLIRIYHSGDKGKIEHLKGFLAGADPGEVAGRKRG